MRRTKRTTNTPTRFNPSPEVGLSAAEVTRRVGEGYTNYVKKSSAKPTWRIFADNICTYFNLIWAIIIGVIIFLGEFDQLFFVLVILANTAIAIITELQAKYTLEKLNLVTRPLIRTVRNGETVLISADDLVLDDIVILEAGNQIPADAVVLSGTLEVNESMLTGESDAIKKTEGDTLFASSFIISGGCHARIDRVGEDSYIQSVAKRVKTFKAPQSYLFRDINRIIKYIGIFILPFSVIMYLNNAASMEMRDALLKTAGSLEGMIPAGMFLLITVAFSLGVVKLSRRKAKVKDAYSIEMLARTNMLCLDKTGTITDGTMRVVAEEELTSFEGVENANVIASIMAAQTGANFTSDALNRHYKVKEPLTVTHNIPFSSKRKFTATAFQGLGTFAIGAPEFLSLGELPAPLTDQLSAYAAAGQRVLLLAGSHTEADTDTLPDGMQALSIIVLEDHIREEAADTLAWFRENNVHVKIISGDNPLTVSAIARRVGVENAERYISLEGMSDEEVAAIADDYTVFGRVTPDQKLALVRRLRACGYVVSMTGDGVNDTMALKEADCSIAMADGSEVARSLSSIVLLDNNFATLPAVVREGRQVVNNVQRSSTLFLMKTFFTISLSLVCLCAMLPYPFEPNSLFMFEVFVTGLPSVLLTLQPNNSLIEGRFISTVLKQCIPDGIMILLNVLLAYFLRFAIPMSPDAAHTLLVLVLTMTGFVNLVFLCYPFNKIRLGCIALSIAGILGAVLLAGATFGVAHATPTVLLLLVLFVAASLPLHLALSLLYGKIFLRKKKA